MKFQLRASAELHWPAFGPFINTVRAEMYVTPDGHDAVCVLCDGPWNDGTSTINAAEVLVRHPYLGFLRQHAPDARVQFLDTQINPQRNEESPQYAWIAFRDETELTGPGWTYASHTEIGTLIGQSDWRQHRASRSPRRRSVDCRT